MNGIAEKANNSSFITKDRILFVISDAMANDLRKERLKNTDNIRLLSG